jgi:ABC-type dipeptide/oligopeptide/nickel transport system ATPase component
MSNLDPTFTIGTQLIEPLRHHLGLSRGAARARSLELLERVGIADPVRALKSYPHELSGGMAQRVLIAGAISCEPELLIADEPTTALDVTVQAEVLDLLRSLQADMGMGVLLVTHNFGVIADLCDRVAVMKDGLIVETGEVRSIFADPQHEYTRMLFGAILSEDGIRAPYQSGRVEADR